MKNIRILQISKNRKRICLGYAGFQYQKLKKYGRIETRIVYIASDIDWLKQRKD